MKYQNPKIIKILPRDPAKPKDSPNFVMCSRHNRDIPKDPQEFQQELSKSEKPHRDFKKPFKVPHVPEYSPKSSFPSSDPEDDQSSLKTRGFNEALGNSQCTLTSNALDAVQRTQPSFRVLHDPSPHPISSERPMSKFEVQFGLRYNTFTNGTIIEDIVTGSRHEVVIKNVFKPTNKGGMLAFIESDFIPPHPIINPRSYTKDGKYID